MTKSKKKTVKKTVVRERYYPSDPSKLAVGSAIGAAIGSLVGTAFVRRPTLFNEIMEQFGGMLANPEILSMLSGLGVKTGPAPSSPPSPAHPAGGCGVPGCPSNNPHAVAEEEARVSQENPTWTHTQVLIEVSKRLDAQIEAVHMTEPPKRGRSRKKNSEEPEETPN
jgi:hypothetical protein